jgi:hypothetical protein
MSSRSTVTRPKSIRARMQLPAPEVDLGFRWGLANTLMLVGGIALLVTGYISLSRGSITLAPVLLVTGYCVLIPASLLVRVGSSEEGE